MSNDQRQYDYFDYHLPDKSAQYYANRAIKILREIKQEFPIFYRRFRAPSEVLTLSGVRAFDTYYDLGRRAKSEDVQKLKNLLRKRGILLLEQRFPVDGEFNQRHDYSLLHLEAFSKLTEQYGRVPGWQAPKLRYMERDIDFFMWQAGWNQRIASEGWENKLLAQWMKIDWWGPHNISFGMLLGYPGEAIVSCLWETAAETAKNGQPARIKHAWRYAGAIPVYDYSKELVNNPNIVAHEKLWSDILSIVYKELKQV